MHEFLATGPPMKGGGQGALAPHFLMLRQLIILCCINFLASKLAPFLVSSEALCKQFILSGANSKGFLRFPDSPFLDYASEIFFTYVTYLCPTELTRRDDNRIVSKAYL